MPVNARAARAGLVCPKHGKLLDRYSKKEIHKGRKVKIIKTWKFICGCEETSEA